MEKDIFYETPRLPMFMLMEEHNIVRVRALKYVDGELEAVLADWDANNIQEKFYGKDCWNDEFEEPFYCLYKDKDSGRILKNCTDLIAWAADEEKRFEGQYKAKDIMDDVLSHAEVVGCPIFDSIDEARRYVFRT